MPSDINAKSLNALINSIVLRILRITKFFFFFGETSGGPGALSPPHASTTRCSNNRWRNLIGTHKKGIVQRRILCVASDTRGVEDLARGGAIQYGMDDELEDKVFYQTYITHMRLLSKFAMGVTPLNSTLAYIWKLLRMYFIRPEVLLVTVLFIVVLVYLQALEMWSRGLVSRIGTTLSFSSMRHGRSNNHITSTMSPAEKQSWEDRQSVSAAYAVQGRRPRMEDR